MVPRALPILLLTAMLCSGCAAAWSYSGPGSRNGVAHGVAAVATTWGSEKLTGSGWYGAVGACAYFIGHETEETRVWTEFHSGRWDSALDVIVPCAVGAVLAKVLR